MALSVFSWVCWIKPGVYTLFLSRNRTDRISDNIILNQLFGTHSGLGMGLLTFDWVRHELLHALWKL